MISNSASLLRAHPEIALFLTLAFGYVIGKIQIAGHELGLVTGSLFAGLIMGQIAVEISPQIKTIFLLLFLFANGYGAGPQFFRALRADGVTPLLLTLVVCFTGLFMVWLMSRILGLDTGYSAGLLSGSLTQSSAIGTATEAIMNLNLSDAEKRTLVNQIPIADAVCYLFGFWGEVFFVAAILPKLMGIDIEREASKLEEKLGMKEDKGLRSAYTIQTVRALRYETGRYPTVGALEQEAVSEGLRLVVLRIRRGDRIEDATPSTQLAKGDLIAIAGQRRWLLKFADRIGKEEEEDDAALLDIPFATANVLVTNASAEKLTLAQMVQAHDAIRGVFVTRLTRASQPLPITAATRLQRGDTISLAGEEASLAETARMLGYWEKPTVFTNMLTLGLGIAFGCLIGLPAFAIGGIKLSLSTAVGTLLAGLLMGWLHSRRPRIVGSIPEPSRVFLVNFGLAGYVAITGLHAGPEFISSLKSVGLSLFFAGIICTCVPPTVGMIFGKYVLRMNPILLLGGVAGAQTMTAAMVAVQERAKSQAPVLGFTVPYALGNIILTMFGTVIVLLTS